ncbi:MAG: hypothetical protein ACREUE_14500, partial [Panacagrimonas sp.]
MFSKLDSMQWMAVGFVVISVMGMVVAWLFKPEPKSLVSLIVRCIAAPAIAFGVLHLVRSPGAEWRRLEREGERASATVLQVESTNVLINRRPQVRLRLRIEPAGKSPYEVSRLEVVGLGQSVMPGRRLAVLVDREKPDSLVIDWSG